MEKKGRGEMCIGHEGESTKMLKLFQNLPSALILVSTMAFRNIKVDVDGRELHVVLILEGV